MINVAVYCRVSTDKTDQSNSFEAQQRYFSDYISQKADWSLSGIYADEGITGTNTKRRAEFNRMINDACEGKFQLILTKEVSRFSRNILDTISYTRKLKAVGIGVLFVIDGINTLNPDSELYLSIMASMAQEESRKISARVVWGQTRQMEQGVVFGRSLLGYRVKNGKICIEPAGAEIVRLIFQKYALEQASTSEIVHWLNCSSNLSCCENRKWSSCGVIKILKNEKYVGDLVQRKTYTPDYLTHEKRKNKGEIPLIRINDHHEPIISREIWNLAQRRLNGNRKNKESCGGCSNRYPFSGKIKCGECGSAFVGRVKYLKDGTKVRRWRCGNATTGGTISCSIGKTIRDDDAVNMLYTAMKSIGYIDREIIKDVTKVASEAILLRGIDSQKSLDQIKFEAMRIQKKKETMMDSFFSGEINKEEMTTLKQRYDQELYKLQTLETSNKAAILTKQALSHTIESELSAILDGVGECDVFIKTILHSITVFRDRHIELKLQNLPHIFYFTE